jgi:hypothetical protein
MKILTKVAFSAIALLVMVVVAQPAAASCGVPYVISNVEDADNYASIYTDGLWCGGGVSGYCPDDAMTAAASGVFWALGGGDAADGVGNDNGTWLSENWLYGYYYPGYGFAPFTLFTAWDAPGVDGCINLTGGLGSPGTCTCILLTDELNGVGKFAAVSVQTDAGGDSYLNRTTGNAPIVLRDMPKPQILGSTRDPGTFNIVMNITVPPPASGLYEAATCGCAEAVSYKLYQAVVPRGDAPPASRDIAVGGWSEMNLAGAVPQPLGGTPAGTPVSVESLCGASNTDVFVTAQLVFDSGFATDVVSTNSTRVECGPNIAEPQPIRPKVRPGNPTLGRGARGERSR